jgi:D-alanyl-D-alanine endopeptidase (penicillin-binding protein 7)
MFKLFISALLAAAVALSTPAAQAKTPRKGATAKTASAKVVKKKTVSKRRKQVLADGRATAAPRDRLVRRVVRINGKRRVVYERVLARSVVPARPSMGDLAGLSRTPDPLSLASNVAFVIDQDNAEVLLEKNADVALPIASITKLMTGLIVVEARQDLDEVLVITQDDVDREKFTSSRLAVGSRVRRGDLLHISLMSSENRAAAALARNYPGGVPAFVEAMNAKAEELGMTDTRYVDSSGLSSRNVSSARDLAKLATYAYREPLLRQFSTDPKSVVDAGGRMMHYNNTNYLVALPDWNIGLQKTGFINEAGRCLLMQAVISGRSVIMVFLDSKGKQSRTADAGRVRRWLESLKPDFS